MRKCEAERSLGVSGKTRRRFSSRMYTISSLDSIYIQKIGKFIYNCSIY